MKLNIGSKRDRQLRDKEARDELELQIENASKLERTLKDQIDFPDELPKVYNAEDTMTTEEILQDRFSLLKILKNDASKLLDGSNLNTFINDNLWNDLDRLRLAVKVFPTILEKQKQNPSRLILANELIAAINRLIRTGAVNSRAEQQNISTPIVPQRGDVPQTPVKPPQIPAKQQKATDTIDNSDISSYFFNDYPAMSDNKRDIAVRSIPTVEGVQYEYQRVIKPTSKSSILKGTKKSYNNFIENKSKSSGTKADPNDLNNAHEWLLSEISKTFETPVKEDQKGKIDKYFKGSASGEPVSKSEGERNSEPVKKKGNGLEVIHHGKKMKVKYGRGEPIERHSLYLPFGDNFIIHKHQLDGGMLNVKYKTFAPTKYPKQIISEDLAEVIQSASNGHVPNKLFNLLSDSDKALFRRLLVDAKISSKFPNIIKEGEGIAVKSTPMDRFEIIRGEIVAGNTSQELKDELKKYIVFFVKNKMISQDEADGILDCL